MKRTKQGVRDLDSLPSKPAGKKLSMPPKAATACRHPHEDRKTIWASGDTYCGSCGKIWDWTGQEF